MTYAPIVAAVVLGYWAGAASHPEIKPPENVAREAESLAEVKAACDADDGVWTWQIDREQAFFVARCLGPTPPIILGSTWR